MLHETPIQGNSESAADYADARTSCAGVLRRCKLAIPPFGDKEGPSGSFSAALGGTERSRGNERRRPSTSKECVDERCGSRAGQHDSQS